MKSVNTVGLLYETIDDAKKLGFPLELLDHWREDKELAAIEQAIQSAGFSTVRIGTPYEFVDGCNYIKPKVDFIMTLSVGFRTRYRQALGAMACELAQLPYSGPDPYAKIATQNKHLLKSMLDKISINTPPWIYIHNEEMMKQKLLKFPLIVKPACEGTSVGIKENAVVTTRKELNSYVKYILHDLGYPVIVEQFITGKEFKICYIGNGTDLWRGILEDVHEDGSSLGTDFFHYDAKLKRIYKKDKRDISLPEFQPIIKDCDFVYTLFTPADYGVFDIRQDVKGRFYLVDFNLDATLHPEKTLATCCNLNGMSYKDMIHVILKASFKRQEIAWS